MKKLLVTLGCSMTEGVGCYVDDMPHTKENFQDLFDASVENFHQKGWPPKLCKKLGFDKLLNISKGGGSTSGVLKLFVENFLHEDYSDYEVHILFYLPSASRISFYINNKISNFLLNGTDPISETLIMYQDNPIEDAISEQIFYIKLIEQICENNDWRLYLLHTDYEQQDEILNLYPSKHFLHQDYNFLYFGEGPREKYHAIDDHPNESGYEILAENIYKQILKQHPNIVGKSKKFINIWKGEIEKKLL